AYVFVSRDEFIAHREAGGFLEWNEFTANGHLYGTPMPEAPEDRFVLLEIDVNGARQVKERLPGARLVLVVPPSLDELERRLRGRGDADEHVARRLQLAEDEMTEGRAIADEVVMNDDLVRAVEEVAGILDRSRPPAG
ncbi:MAG: guanylate kinase, partial [Acidimicrobiales bacterium]